MWMTFGRDENLFKSFVRPLTTYFVLFPVHGRIFNS